MPSSSPSQVVERHTITLEKRSDRALNEKKVRVQIDSIVNGVNNKSRTDRGWTIEVTPASKNSVAGERPDPDGKYSDTSKIYDVTLKVTWVGSMKRSSLHDEFYNIVKSVIGKGAPPAMRWTVTAVDGENYDVEKVTTSAEDEVGYAPIEIPSDILSNFAHLYGLDPHINRVIGALEAAIRSDWQHRFHCALVGPPACGKSDMLQSLKRALGEEAVLEFDATATTAAGAILELKQRAELPRVLIVEEIEKAAENSMQFLLSIMDLRGNIKKRTARGNVDRSARMLVLATVNNMSLFKKIAAGALESRFSNKIYFKRPTRDLLEQILVREIESIGGKMQWIEPALNFATELGTSDPREIIALAICGGDRLLDGSYQHDVRATGHWVIEGLEMPGEVKSE